MQEAQVIDYAKSLLDAHGDKAEAEAAARIRQFEEKNDKAQAETWRKVKATIHEMRGPHLS
jgi:hypothetical protein